MQLKSMKATNFGKLPNKKFVFGKGLTVVKGPNEAGKSFSIEAITQGIFGDATSSSAHIRNKCRKWGTEGDFSITLDFESDGKEYRILRDFENKKNVLLKPDGTEIKDKETIRKLISSLIGLPSQTAFEATACIPQEEVERIGSETSTLREIIESRLAGSVAGTEKIVKKLVKGKESIVSRRGTKGLLITVENEISEISRELDELQERLSKHVDNKKELEKTSKKFARQSLILRDKENAYKGSQEYISAQNRYESADKSFREAIDNLEKFKNAIQDIQNAEKELKSLKKKLEAISRLIEDGEAFKVAQIRCKELENDITRLERKISNLNEIDLNIRKKEKEIASYKEVDNVELQNAKSIPLEIKSLRTSLSKQLFGVKVTLESDVDYSIVADGKKVKGKEAQMHAEATIEFPGIANVEFRNLTGEEEPLVDEIDRKENVLGKIFKKYGVKSVENLEDLYERRKASINEKENLRTKRETILDGEEFSKLKIDLNSLKNEFKKENKIKDELKSYSLTEVQLKKNKGQKSKIVEKKEKMENLIIESKGILKAIGKDENQLKERKNKATREMALAEEQLKKYEIHKCSSEEFEKIKRETQELKNDVDDLKERQAILNDRIEQEMIGEDDIAELEEKLSSLDKKRERLSHKHRIFEIINEGINWARQNSITQFSEAIEKQMSELLSKITDGKYKKVKVDENLGVNIYSEEKSEYINLDDKKDLVSSGTLDQIYLAARISIINLITTEGRPLIILDDTFVSFDDMGRKERAFEVLKSFAKDYQILYFTCHECPPKLNVVELK